ncbi:chemokine XC receptor 1-like [Hemibagrus wyckioides]|uniref:chemokine XC receptor 1-like n=1 Tax=Hemibagrus wyckioides TaxID=337641 RepID=UPI00266B556B|nr:chemokine XC receptor 1-like [Hemibagrus wyckioides]
MEKSEINTSTETPYELFYESIYSYYDAFPCVSGYEAGHKHIAVSIILSAVILISLIGNLLVVVISVFYMNLKSLTNIFILNLALSDLLFTAGLPFWVSEYAWGATFGDAGCKVVIFLLATGFYSSVMFLVLMSFQRYMAVLHPLLGWIKGHGFTLVPIIAWVVSVSAALPATVHSTAMSDPEGLVFYCMYSSLTAFVAISYEEIITFVCILLLMAFCYIRILQTIFKSPTNQNCKHSRVTGLSFFLVVTFFIFWAPSNIVNFLQLLYYHNIMFITHCEILRLEYASYICQPVAITRCCLNPVIYLIFGVKFRKTVREVFQRRTALNAAQMRMVECHSDSF